MTPTYDARTEEERRDPAAALCELVHRRCGFRIPKVTMEAMFAAEWSKLSTLAHAIHNEQQRRLSAQDNLRANRGAM